MMELEDAEAGEEEADLPGWGHWAMPQNLIDQELHQGEFLALNDIVEPFDAEILAEGENANSSITISDGPSDNSAGTDASANGPLAPMQPALPDLNAAVGPIGLGPIPLPLGPPVLAQQLLIQAANNPPQVPAMEWHPPAIQPLPIMDLSIEIIMEKYEVFQDNSDLDPMQLEFQSHSRASLQLKKDLQAAVNTVNTTLSEPVLAAVTELQENQLQNMNIEEVTNEIEGGTSDLSAPPGFPIPAFLHQAHTICPSNR